MSELQPIAKPMSRGQIAVMLYRTHGHEVHPELLAAFLDTQPL